MLNTGKSMNYKQIIGVVLLIIGVALVVYSMQRMDTFRETIAMKVSGKYSKETMWYLISGILMVIFGGCASVIFRATNRRK